MVLTVTDIGKIRSQIRQEIFDYRMLLQCLADYSKPRDKIRRLLLRGDVVRVRKGLYVFGEVYRRGPVRREVLANLIYGPSYVSLDYALAWHNLIPERVETVTSVTTGRSRDFATPFGAFTYRLLGEGRYAVGVCLEQADGTSFLMASPEKALVDKVWSDKRFAGDALTDYGPYIVDDLRLDVHRLRTLDWRRLNAIGKAYASPKIARLVRYLRTFQESGHA